MSAQPVTCTESCPAFPAAGASANVESKKQEKRLEEVRSSSCLMQSLRCTAVCAACISLRACLTIALSAAMRIMRTHSAGATCPLGTGAGGSPPPTCTGLVRRAGQGGEASCQAGLPGCSGGRREDCHPEEGGQGQRSRPDCWPAAQAAAGHRGHAVGAGGEGHRGTWGLDCGAE